MPPHEYLSGIAVQSADLGPTFTHYFWTNCPSVQDQVRNFFIENNAPVEVRLISELRVDIRLQTIYEKLIAAKKYVLAADVKRLSSFRIMVGSTLT